MGIIPCSRTLYYISLANAKKKTVPLNEAGQLLNLNKTFFGGKVMIIPVNFNSFFHNVVSQRDSFSYDLLFFNRFVPSFLKERLSPDYAVGCRISPHQRFRSQAVTAGQGFHLAPKIFI